MTEPVRREAILIRLDALHRAVVRLRAHQSTSITEYLHNQDEQWIVERGLQLAAEAALDICSHIAAALRLPPPEDYTQAVDRLATAGILPAPFAAEFRKIGGFRNVLTHAYLEIDPQTVHTVLVDRLDDFDVFARHVAAFLDRPASPVDT